MAVTVECLSCHVVYETDAPSAAVREVNRCQECGQRSLVIAEEEEAPAEGASGGRGADRPAPGMGDREARFQR